MPLPEGLIVLLTGGLSTRMGQPKALLPLHSETKVTFLQRLIELTQGLSNRRVVVSSLPAETLDCDLPVVRQTQPELGQLSSLLLGWEAYAEDSPWVMCCLVDHPYVRRETIESLIRATSTAPKAMMWCPSHQHRGGHPVIFNARLKSKLIKTPLHLGARPVVRSVGKARHWVETDDEAVLWDVDTPEDYRYYSELWRERNP